MKFRKKLFKLKKKEVQPISMLEVARISVEMMGNIFDNDKKEELLNKINKRNLN